jgi:hypothetical protein
MHNAHFVFRSQVAQQINEFFDGFKNCASHGRKDSIILYKRAVLHRFCVLEYFLYCVVENFDVFQYRIQILK